VESKGKQRRNQWNRRSTSFVDKNAELELYGSYNKKDFHFERDLDALVTDCSFEFNPSDARLVVRSPTFSQRLPAGCETAGDSSGESSGDSRTESSNEGGLFREGARTGGGGRRRSGGVRGEEGKDEGEPEGDAKGTAEVVCRDLLFNFRDLSESIDAFLPGLVFRSAALTRAKVGPQDVHRALVFLRKGLNIKTIIDLRTKDEKLSDKLDWLVETVPVY